MKTDVLPASPEEDVLIEQFWNSLSKKDEEKVIAHIQKGLDDLNNGRTISHEDVMKQINEKLEHYKQTIL